MNWTRIRFGVLLALAILMLIQEFYDQVQRHEGLHFSSGVEGAAILFILAILNWPNIKKPN